MRLLKMHDSADLTVSHVILYFHSLLVTLLLLVHVLLNCTSVFS